MEEYELKNKVYSYAFYCGFVAAIVAALMFYNAYIFIAACAMLLLAAAFQSTGHLLSNLLLRHSNVIEIWNGYTLSDDLAGAYKQVGNTYYGVSIARLRLRKDSEMSSVSLKPILENLTESFEFSVSAFEIDKGEMLEALETKRKMREIAMSRIAERSYQKINETKRQLDILGGEIASIRDDGKAFDVVIRLRAIAKSANEIEATRLSARSLAHMTNLFSANLGVDCEILRGEALMKALDVV